MSEPHVVSEPMNEHDYYRALQMAQGQCAELEGTVRILSAAQTKLIAERNELRDKVKSLQGDVAYWKDEAERWKLEVRE